MAAREYEKWKKRMTVWVAAIVMSGITGLVGSVSSVVAEMDPLDFSQLKLGTIIVILAWIIGTGVSAGLVWAYSWSQVKKIEKKRLRESRGE